MKRIMPAFKSDMMAKSDQTRDTSRPREVSVGVVNIKEAHQMSVTQNVQDNSQTVNVSVIRAVSTESSLI